MLFIFRKLRRSFFLPGKVRTYLAYALGEIALIVVGILIAVQIGDWKDERKLDQQRLELIENLKADFNASLQRLVETIEEGSNTNAELFEFLNLSVTENSHLSVDELKWLGGAAFRPYSFRPALNAYSSARDNGSLALINNLELTELFIDFEEWYGNYQVNTNLDREFTLTGDSYEVRKRLGTMAVLRADTRFNTPDKFALSDKDYLELIAQREVYAFFELKYKLRGNQMRNLENLKPTIEQIIATLESL
jgi:hypothetical protein